MDRHCTGTQRSGDSYQETAELYTYRRACRTSAIVHRHHLREIGDDPWDFLRKKTKISNEEWLKSVSKALYGAHGNTKWLKSENMLESNKMLADF